MLRPSQVTPRILFADSHDTLLVPYNPQSPQNLTESARALTSTKTIFAVVFTPSAYDSPMATKCFKYAWKTCQPTVNAHGHYFYTQLYMSQAVWQKGDKYWDKYYPAIQRGYGVGQPR